MIGRKAFATGFALLAVGLGCAGCQDHAAPVPPRPQDELSQIRTTLDAIDSEMASDASP
ncbi:hypothetical protein [Amycolatopsis alkalitolerans]|uniref:hypothetical protein n=1 Tax=Amycolatopsis alkalitolerans TaxID=2547244 RepID=UPI00135869CF|nr:hypothetical protein [Amycolatopsis alkalitolerans]